MANAQVRYPTVAELNTAEQFVLGACRCWDVFMEHPDPALPWRELGAVFHYMTVPRAMCAFEHAFRVLHAGAGHRLRFADVDSAALAADETRLLSSVGLLQRSDVPAACELLAESLPRLRVRMLLPPLARIATILATKGHRLRPSLAAASFVREAPQREIDCAVTA